MQRGIREAIVRTPEAAPEEPADEGEPCDALGGSCFDEVDGELEWTCEEPSEGLPADVRGVVRPVGRRPIDQQSAEPPVIRPGQLKRSKCGE